MISQNFQTYVSQTSLRAIHFMPDLADAKGPQVGHGLPAGSVRLPDARLVVAATPCDAPFFEGAVRKIAASLGSDMVLMKHNLPPKTLNTFSFAALVYINGPGYWSDDLILYFHRADGYWLVPPTPGPLIALEKDSVRVDVAPPFVTFDERDCEAAAQMARAVGGGR